VGGISYFFDDVPTKSPIAKKIKKIKIIKTFVL